MGPSPVPERYEFIQYEVKTRIHRHCKQLRIVGLDTHRLFHEYEGAQLYKIADPEYGDKQHPLDADVPLAAKGPFFVEHEAVEKTNHIPYAVRQGVMYPQAFHKDEYYSERNPGIEHSDDTEPDRLHHCGAQVYISR